jgi:recombination protein RecA
VPRAEIEGEMGDAHVGLQARLMSQALRKLAGITHRSGATIMFINQLRMKIGVTWGSPETTTGGHALKYYASVRLDIRRIGALKVGEETCGNHTRIKVVKNKLAPPFQTTELDIRYGTGIDRVGDILDLAVARGIVDKRGAHLALDGELIGQGREKAREALIADAGLLESLQRRVEAVSSEPISARGNGAPAQEGEEAAA